MTEFTNSKESQHVSCCYQQQTSTDCPDKTPPGRARDGFRDVNLEQTTFSLLELRIFSLQSKRQLLNVFIYINQCDTKEKLEREMQKQYIVDTVCTEGVAV